MKTITASLSLLLLTAAGPTLAATAEESAELTVCKPGSAIRRTLDQETDLAQVRKAPAHGSCRNTASPKRGDSPPSTAADASEGYWICKPGSAIRYRVAGKPDPSMVRFAPTNGSCRR